MIDQVGELQKDDPYCVQIKNMMDENLSSVKEFALKDGLLCFKDRVVITEMRNLRETIMQEAHQSLYSAHPGGTKMRANLKKKLLLEVNEAGCGKMHGISKG